MSAPLGQESPWQGAWNPYPNGYSIPAKPPPRRFWYGIGAGLLGLGLILGVAGLLLVMKTFNSLPGADTEFRSGRVTTVSLTPGQTRTVFIRSTAGPHEFFCQFRDDTGGQHIRSHPDEMAIKGWEAKLDIGAEVAGDYEFRCTGHPTDLFRIGETPSVSAFFGAVGAVIVGGVLLVSGVLVVLLIAVLRRRRLAPPNCGPQV
jgi:hypothetical protein